MRFQSSPVFARFVAALGLCSLTTVAAVSGCQSAPPEDFATLQPLFFSSINVFDDQTQKALPDFEQRLGSMADGVMDRASRGEITDPTERAQAGLALFYAAFVLHVGHHGIEDGFTDPAMLLRPARYAPGGDDQAELAARMTRSGQLLDQAAVLRPTDSQVATLQRSVRFNQEVLAGGPTQATLDSLVTAANTDRFSMFAALILLRDPARYPLSAPYMEQLVAVVCSPQWYNCDSLGPPAPADPMEPRWLTNKVAGPVLLSDFLARRVEVLLARADANPAVATASLQEAKQRLQIAGGSLVWAEVNSSSADLSIYPASDTLDARQGRIDALRAGLMARLAGMSAPPLPEATQYYASRAYRAAYQCSACHMPRSDMPATFGDVPK